MTVAMSCTTSALCHKDIISNLSPMFALIPELCTPGTSPSPDSLADSSHVAGISRPVGPSNVADTPCLIDSSTMADRDTHRPVDSSHVADANALGNPAPSSFISGESCRPPPKLHSVVPMPSALGSPSVFHTDLLAGNPAPLSYTSKLRGKAPAPHSVDSGNAANMDTTLAGNPAP